MFCIPMGLNKSFCWPYPISPLSSLLFHSGVSLCRRCFGGEIRAVVPFCRTDWFDSAERERLDSPTRGALSSFLRTEESWMFSSLKLRSVRTLFRLEVPSLPRGAELRRNAVVFVSDECGDAEPGWGSQSSESSSSHWLMAGDGLAGSVVGLCMNKASIAGLLCTSKHWGSRATDRRLVLSSLVMRLQTCAEPQLSSHNNVSTRLFACAGVAAARPCGLKVGVHGFIPSGLTAFRKKPLLGKAADSTILSTTLNCVRTRCRAWQVPRLCPQVT